ncbi:MAG: tRNA lysidine(34) synthetase TilS [Gammaproteobacteria bacterium]|nr:tRNA lysidine(34) synthetase TilS [Gammaproteobacteria bacterium]
MSFVKRFKQALESLTALAEVPDFSDRRYVVAYSGGVDSHVLLYCAKQAGLSVRAVHVHHGLQEVADDWVLHCQSICQQLDVPLHVVFVDAQKKPGDSPEESARKVRYQALYEAMDAGECLLTAQHLNDQAETLLLQLFRTASSAGLSSMPVYQQFGVYQHARPLLSFSREEIEHYAAENNLRWIEDPSNKDVAFDRNFLRKNILPELKKRWPEVISQLSIVADLQANNLKVLEDMAAIDLANVLVTQSNLFTASIAKVVSILSIDRLKQLSPSRLLNVLRYWVITSLEQQPTRKLLHELEKTLIYSSPDAKPSLAFLGFTFKKFHSNLYLLETRDISLTSTKLDWQPPSVMKITALDIQLKVVDVAVGDSTKYRLHNELQNKMLSIGFRQGGENFHPAGRQHSQRLKKLFQEAGIPPWEREVTPLLYYDDELIAVIGHWLSKKYLADEAEAGWKVAIERL